MLTIGFWVSHINSKEGVDNSSRFVDPFVPPKILSPKLRIDRKMVVSTVTFTKSLAVHSNHKRLGFSSPDPFVNHTQTQLLSCFAFLAHKELQKSYLLFKVGIEL